MLWSRVVLHKTWEITSTHFFLCIVSTGALMAFFSHLLTEPHTTILGNKELFIEAGSTINLTCIIQAGALRDTHIFWNYNGKVSLPPSVANGHKLSGNGHLPIL